MAEMILFDVVLQTTAEQRDAMLALLGKSMAGSQVEAGCLLYRFTADLDDPLRFYLVELWESEAALMGHAQGVPFKTFLAELPSCGAIVSSTARTGELAPYRFRRPQ